MFLNVRAYALQELDAAVETVSEVDGELLVCLRSKGVGA